MGDFKRSPSGSNHSQVGQQQQLLKASDESEERPFISKSPSNSSFGFENTFRVLESQVSQNSTLSGGAEEDNEGILLLQPPIVTTLELELGAVARLQQFNYYSTPKSNNQATTRISRPATTVQQPTTRPEDCDKYLEFLNQFIRKSRQKVKSAAAERDVVADDCDKVVSITVSGSGDDAGEPGLVEFGEYPELVYCIAKDKTGRYRLQNKDQRRIKSPQGTNNNEGI